MLTYPKKPAQHLEASPKNCHKSNADREHDKQKHTYKFVTTDSIAIIMIYGYRH